MNLNSNPSRSDHFVFAGIVFLLIFAPLAFGSIHVWAYCLIELIVFALLAIWLFDQLIFSKGPVSWTKTPVTLFLLLFLAIVAVQAIPFPSFITGLVAPRTFEDKMFQTGLMTDILGAKDAGKTWMQTAYYVNSAVVEWAKAVVYAGLFFLVLNTVKTRRRIIIVVWVLIGIGLFESLYAIYQAFSENPKVWWWTSRVGRAKYATGTFVLSNNFAGYMEMMFFLVLGMTVSQIGKTKRKMSKSGRKFIRKLIDLLSPESELPKSSVFIFITIVIGTALLMSASRAGIISAGISLFITAALFLAKKRYRVFGIFILILGLSAFIYGIHLGIDPTLKKFERLDDDNPRFEISKSFRPMIADYPVLGVGLGNFRYLYPRYMVDGKFDLKAGYPYNDWLEAFVETGIAGGAMIVCAFFVYFFGIARAWRRRRDPLAVGIGIGVMGGMVSVGIHSFFEFNIHIPAIPLTLAALLAIGHLAVHGSARKGRKLAISNTKEIPLNRPAKISIACLIVILYLIFSVAGARHFIAETYCPTEWNSTLNLNWNPYLTDIQKAIALNPLNAEYRFKEGKYYMQGAFLGDKTLGKAFIEKAIQSYEEAVRLNPANGKYWFDLGKCYAYKSDNAGDSNEKWLAMADGCLDMAVKCRPKDAGLLFQVALHWVGRSKDLPVTVSSGLARGTAIKKFQNLFGRSLEINPKNWKKAAEVVWNAYPEESIVRGITPINHQALPSMINKWIKKAKI